MALDIFRWCVQAQNGGGGMSSTNNIREVMFGNGYRQVGSAGFNTNRREFAITYAGEEDIDVLEFMRSHLIKPFAFTPTKDKIGVFLVKPDSVSTTPLASGLLEVKCSIVEQFTSA